MKHVAVFTTMAVVLTGGPFVSAATEQTALPYPGAVYEDPVLHPPTAKTLAERVNVTG